MPTPSGCPQQAAAGGEEPEAHSGQRLHQGLPQGPELGACAALSSFNQAASWGGPTADRRGCPLCPQQAGSGLWRHEGGHPDPHQGRGEQGLQEGDL